MKKKGIAVLITAIMVGTLTACGGSAKESSSSGATAEAESSSAMAEEAASDSSSMDNEGKKITVVMKATSSEYWQYMIAGCTQAGEDLGVSVDCIGPTSESEIAQQVAQIEEQISAKVDALVIAPTEENAVIGACQEHVEELPILMVDSNADLKGKKAFIGTGNKAAAKLGGEYVAKNVENGKVILIGGQQGEATQTQRLEGFTEGLTEGGAEILETQYGNNTSDGAIAVMENMLTKYPGEINAVCCINDDEAIGVQQACKNAGVEDIMIIGFDGSASAVELIESGSIAATVAQQPYAMGYQAVEQALKCINGETIEENQEVSAQLVTKENAAEYIKNQADMLQK